MHACVMTKHPGEFDESLRVSFPDEETGELLHPEVCQSPLIHLLISILIGIFSSVILGEFSLLFVLCSIYFHSMPNL